MVRSPWIWFLRGIRLSAISCQLCFHTPRSLSRASRRRTMSSASLSDAGERADSFGVLAIRQLRSVVI
uniref:Uncharacterized protein n=1 Tax=uncultured marine virus TaxID=186617 RepID=A0A0F7L811_9VIRU|nr:hypothetical protein [uncultured marine virus]